MVDATPESAPAGHALAGCDSTQFVDIEPARGAAAPQPDRTLIGPYVLGRELGRGAMGAVYEATHTKLKRRVAIKLLPATHVHLPNRVNRFGKEMEAIGRLDHPNIVRAFDAGEADGVHYLAMEFVEGIDLQQLMTQRTVTPAAAANIIYQAALGLQHIHQHQLVHRDIKPSNLMLTREGVVKILDLGIAKLRNDENHLTAIGGLIGTPDYLAPEQALHCDEIDIRADIYSLGCTFYTLLAGQIPFGGPTYENQVDKLLAHCNEAPRPLGDLVPGLAPALVQVVEKMMAKQPAERYQTPQEVAEALGDWSTSSGARVVAAELPRPGVGGGVPTNPAGPASAATVAAPQIARRAGRSLFPWRGRALLAVMVLGTVAIWFGTRLRRDVASIPAPQSDAGQVSTPLLGGIADDTTQIREHAQRTATNSQELVDQTARIAETLETIQHTLGSGGQLFESPTNAGEAVHNARVLQAQGNHQRAKENFLLAIRFNPNLVDVHQAFADLMILHYGRSIAQQELRLAAASAGDEVREYVSTLACDWPARRKMLQELVDNYPRFAPAVFDLSYSYSPDVVGLQTLADMSHEKFYLARFQELDAEGQVLAYLLDHTTSVRWREHAQRRLAALQTVPDDVRQQAVRLSVARTRNHWRITIDIAESAREISYRLSSDEPWQSTGQTQVTDPRTGHLSPQRSIFLPSTLVNPALEIQYVDGAGQLRGPFVIPINTQAAGLEDAKRKLDLVRHDWVRFGRGDHAGKLFFGTLQTYAEAIAEVCYGLDSDAPTVVHNLRDSVEEISPDVQSIVVRLIFKDGSESATVRIPR